jgi:hypothetical protein
MQRRDFLGVVAAVPVGLRSLNAFPLSAQTMVRGEIVERDGIERHGTLWEQGVPIAPMEESEARQLTIKREDGRNLPSVVEPEAYDQNHKVNWVRISALVSLPAHGRLPVRIERNGGSEAPRLSLQRSDKEITVECSSYRLILRQPGELRLAVHGKPVLAGNWSVEVIGDARALQWGAFFQPFVPTGMEIEDQSDTRATLLLKGYIPKFYRKEPKIEPGRRIDCELRLFVTALSPHIRYAWRITNLIGVKTWLQRYALRITLAGKSTILPGSRSERILLDVGGGKVGITANFIEDLGKGAGMRLADHDRVLLLGGLDMPPDGGFFVGHVPDIHRLFYHGMSRTFRGALIAADSLDDAAEEQLPLDLVLPPQYYSDTQALPEQGDPVTLGEFEKQIRLSGEWLLKSQWRGTLWWGEWYREWDEPRNMGTQEASNGDSPLAPLYHYWRTGDARFLRCAERSAWYVWDVQLDKSEDDQGRMFHTRRHLFDELDWIHPRYQRAKGGLLTSHVFLNTAARREIIKTIRSFHQHMFSEQGIPYSWDKPSHRRSTTEDGVDTSNFMWALSECYRETGDRAFLDWALQMSRWTASHWKERGHKQGDDWNWNLAQYVLRGLVSLYQASNSPEVRDLAIEIGHATLANPSKDIADLKDGMGGGDGHFVFYNAWVTTDVAKFAPDGNEMVRMLLPIVRREVSRQRADGQFSKATQWFGVESLESGAPTIWLSYYDPLSLVDCVPILTARLARLGIG